MVHQKPAWRQLELYPHFNLFFWSHLQPQFLCGFQRLFCFRHPAVLLQCRIFLEIPGRYLMKVLMGSGITGTFSGAGRRNNSIWKLSTLCAKNLLWTHQCCFSSIFLYLKVWPCTFLFLRRNKWNISGVTKKLNFLFIKGIVKLACGWKSGDEHLSSNYQCKYLHSHAVEDVQYCLQSPSIVIFKFSSELF